MDPLPPPATGAAPFIAPVIAPGVSVVAPIAPIIKPPAYNINLDNATVAIGTLPSLHSCPLHTNICALKRVLFDRLETLQSTQSEEWGFQGLAEQPAEYALKSSTAWVNSPNSGQH